MLKLEDVDNVPFRIDPSATPWQFHSYGIGDNGLITMHSHDGTELGHFYGPKAHDNVAHLCAMLRVCGGIDPEMLRKMLTIHEIAEGRWHRCSKCGHLMCKSLVKGPDNGDGTPKAQ